MHFYKSNSTLDSLKSIFKVFKGKLSLGAPVNWRNEREKTPRNWYNCIKIRQKRIKTR